MSLKYHRIILFTFSALLLFGCDATPPDISYTENYTPNPQMTSDEKLVSKNDTASSDLGEVQLIQANFEKVHSEIGPLELTFHDAKELVVEPDVSMIDYFHALTTEEQFHLVKAFVTVKNTSDAVVLFNPAAAASVSKEEQWTWEQELYLDELNGRYEPGQTKLGNIGFILTKSTDPTSFSLQTSEVFNEQQEVISSGKEISLQLQKK